MQQCQDSYSVCCLEECPRLLSSHVKTVLLELQKRSHHSKTVSSCRPHCCTSFSCSPAAMCSCAFANTTHHLHVSLKITSCLIFTTLGHTVQGSPLCPHVNHSAKAVIPSARARLVCNGHCRASCSHCTARGILRLFLTGEVCTQLAYFIAAAGKTHSCSPIKRLKPSEGENVQVDGFSNAVPLDSDDAELARKLHEQLNGPDSPTAAPITRHITRVRKAPVFYKPEVNILRSQHILVGLNSRPMCTCLHKVLSSSASVCVTPVQSASYSTVGSL